MSLDHFRGSAYVVRKLMHAAEAEIRSGDGELKAARVIHRKAHPKKVLIGAFAARLLRFGRRQA
jgi:hypothetical protein